MTDAELAAARLAALLDAEREIERLRAQRILSNEDFSRAFDMGLAAGERRERAAVVSRLRVEMDYMRAHNLTGGSAHMQGLIAEIESGEHRREEGA